MPAAIEDTVKVDRVELPARGDGRDILVEAGDEGDMSGPRFGGDTGVRDAEGSMIKNSGAEEGCERARD